MFRNDAVSDRLLESYSIAKYIGRDEPITDLRELRTIILVAAEKLNWHDPYPRPTVRAGEIMVVDDGTLSVGSKARFGDLLVSTTVEDELVYVQPRYGWAGISLCALAERYGKKLTLFMPAAKTPSEHQKLTIARGADPRFVRIAAMPILNKYAEQYAARVGAKFIPLGLKHPAVTVAAVKVIYDLLRDYEDMEMWSVISTGVLSRALQIALGPNRWTFHAVAVARNIKEYELGSAHFHSYDLPFAHDARTLPAGFDSASNYDAKGYEYLRSCVRATPRAKWFWNVAGNPPPAPDVDVDSAKEWGDLSDVYR